MPEDTLLGETISQAYAVRTVLARGGMATVYRAHQLSTQRDVAVKVLPPAFLHDDTFRQRFEREARISSKLEHRAIVPVYDYGEWEGLPYIVMRLMEGGSVDDLLRRGPLSVERARDILRQIAAGLDYAHEKGILHRDLKPSNIMLDSVGDAYITDFGIAHLSSYDEKLTSTGVVGTPAYMSPEQAQGHPLDGRSDIYGLGVALFEMLTRRRPFEGDTPYGTAVLQVTGTPPSPRDYNPAISPGVAGVILRALAKQPDDRYPTAQLFAEALRQADQTPAPPPITPTAPTPTSPMPISVTTPPPTSASRMPQAVLFLGGVLLLSLLLGGLLIGGYVLLSDIPRTEPDFAATGAARATLTAQATPLTNLGSGRVVFIDAANNGAPELYRLDIPTRHTTRLTDTDGAEAYPAFSPDGARLAYAYDPDGVLDNDNSQLEIYVREMPSGAARQLTSNLLEEGQPTWFPDGERILYPQEMSGIVGYRLVVQDIPTAQTNIVHTVPGQRLAAPSLSPDGRRVAFAAGDPDAPDSWELYLFDLTTEAVTRLTDNDQPDTAPIWDDERILYWSGSAPVVAVFALMPGGDPQRLTSGPASGARLAYHPQHGLLYSALGGEGEARTLYVWRADGPAPLALHSGQQAVWWP